MRVRHLITEAAFDPKKHRPKAQSSGYPNAAAKDATVTKVAAKSPSDTIKIRVKGAFVPGQVPSMWCTKFVNTTAMAARFQSVSKKCYWETSDQFNEPVPAPGRAALSPPVPRNRSMTIILIW
jgi:hypothetical protein